MTSGNLAYTEIAASQSQKEVTANANFAIFDKAITEQLAVDMSGGAVALSNSQFRQNIYFKPSGNAGTVNLTVPAIKKSVFLIYNGNSATLNIVRGSTTLTLGASSYGWFSTDGTTNGLERVNTAAGSIAFTNLSDVPGSYSGKAGKVVVVKTTEDGLEFTDIVSGAISIDYTFSTTTTDSDPGDGLLRLSAATQNTSTVIRADHLDSHGSDWSAVLPTLDDSTSTIKGFIRLFKKSDPTKFILFSVSAVGSETGYKNITVAVVASSGSNPFSNGDILTVSFVRNGDKGDTGATGGSGAFTGLSDVPGSYTGAGRKFVRVNSTPDGLEFVEVPFIPSVFIAGTLSDSQKVYKLQTPVAFSLPASGTGSYAKADTASTGTVSFDIQKNGGSVGTITFTSDDDGTFTVASQVDFSVGDILDIIAPGSHDATLADVSIALKCFIT
ncbi:hypothetical protein GC176_20550 [bacterium]|nr:hypothetical protein [bacterium]